MSTLFPAPWTCPACTFNNRKTADRCEVCETRKPVKASVAATAEAFKKQDMVAKEEYEWLRKQLEQQPGLPLRPPSATVRAATAETKTRDQDRVLMSIAKAREQAEANKKNNIWPRSASTIYWNALPADRRGNPSKYDRRVMDHFAIISKTAYELRLEVVLDDADDPDIVWI